MKTINLSIQQQPQSECLPTALKAVLDYKDISVPIHDIVQAISSDCTKLNDWIFKAGTFALSQKLKAEVRTLASNIIDPSWYKLKSESLVKKFKEAAEYQNSVFKKNKSHQEFEGAPYNNAFWLQINAKALTEAAIFLEKGGRLEFATTSAEFFKNQIDRGNPVIFSHNPLILHGLARVYDNKPDDIKGYSWGHVAIISGYNQNNELQISDPDGKFYRGEPTYWVNADLVLESILRYNGDSLVIY